MNPCVFAIKNKILFTTYESMKNPAFGMHLTLALLGRKALNLSQ